MPIYSYKCKKCGEIFESRHSMALEPENCEDLPDKDCEDSGKISKDYSSPITTKGTRDFQESEKEEGDLVEEAIEENREELNEKKRKMRREELDPEDL